MKINAENGQVFDCWRYSDRYPNFLDENGSKSQDIFVDGQFAELRWCRFKNDKWSYFWFKGEVFYIVTNGQQENMPVAYNFVGYKAKKQVEPKVVNPQVPGLREYPMPKVYKPRQMFLCSDSGRGTSQHRGETKDCTVRATANLLGIQYDAAHKAMAKLGRQNRKGFLFESYMHSVKAFAVPTSDGWKTCKFEKVQMNGRKTLTQFMLTEGKQGKFLVFTNRHVQAVMFGQLHDDHFASRSKVFSAFRLVQGVE